MSTFKQRETAEAAAALDAILAARPLVPPPLPAHNDTRTAGAIVLANEIREGHFGVERRDSVGVVGGGSASVFVRHHTLVGLLK